MHKDHGFDEFMFNENYKEMFDEVPPVDCPNRYEFSAACPCMYAATCDRATKMAVQKKQQLTAADKLS